MKQIIACPVCQSRELKPASTTRKEGLHSAQVRCVGCGLLISQPQADSEEMDAFYRTEYFEKHWPEDRMNLREDEFHLNQIRNLIGNPIKNQRILDIGCGYGKILSLLQKDGNRCFGSDVSPKATTFARERFGLKNVLCGDWRMAPRLFEQASFDIVLAFHVIEHLPDPGQFVKMLSAFAKNGGWIVIGTENSNHAQQAIEVFFSHLRGKNTPFLTSQEHTYVFNSNNLRRVLRSADLVETRAICYNEIPEKIGVRESPHWRLYKSALRYADKITHQGPYLLAAGRKGYGDAS